MFEFVLTAVEDIPIKVQRASRRGAKEKELEEKELEEKELEPISF